jgi:type II secretory pathway pseudopilin PulG
MIAALDDANNERSLTAMSKINAAMFGILTAAAASWDSYDNDTQRRLRNLRNDASDALEQIRDYMSRGEQIRGRLPSVMDALLGPCARESNPDDARDSSHLHQAFPPGH